MPLLLVALVLAAQGTPPDPPSRALLLELTRSSRLAGTCGSRTAADFVARELEKAGFAAELDQRQVLLGLPRSIELEIRRSPSDPALLSARRESFDPDAVPPLDVPKCLGWSKSGSARGPAVDAGYGTEADFRRLEAAGIDLHGTVALVRYGRCYRGLKVENGAQHGCAAVLLYSDPADDGAAKGPVWPEGPWKPDWDAQRGSVSPMGRAPGDPSTPGWASPHPGETNARRLTPAEWDAALPRIPCTAIGAREAGLILAGLATRTLEDEKGAKAARAVGPGPIEVRLAVEQPRELRTITNVIGRLPGRGERTVLAGNHRDAWVRGANDAGSGTVALLRAAQILGQRAKEGWRPANSITLCFWDAEEWGMIGSTEWGEANGGWLGSHALAYVNADTAVSGQEFGGLSGTPGLLGVVRAVCERTAPVAAPEGATNLWEEWKARSKGEPALGLPGSGSDFAVFLHHLSLPVLDFGLGGAHGGQYHTTFDDFACVERFIDPGFRGHELAGRFLADLLAEIAERGTQCFDAAEAARVFAGLARQAGAENREGKSWLGTERGEKLAAAFDGLAAALDTPALRGRNLYPALSAPEGVPQRAWFKNRLWSPALENGYASETFPVLRAAARAGESELERELEALVAAVHALLPERR